MPCRDTFDDDIPKNTAASVEAKLVPLLCEACDLLEKNDLVSTMSHELLKWAKEHEAQEVARIRKEALDKLSPKERRALGLEYSK